MFMKKQSDHSFEKRTSTRKTRSDVIFWRRSYRDGYKMGLLLERSDEGLAFAWRGDDAPRPNAILDISLDPDSSGDDPKIAEVMRSSYVHDNLAVVAVRLVETLPIVSSVAEAEIKVTLPTVRRKLAV